MGASSSSSAANTSGADPLKLRHLFTFGPAHEDHWVGLRAGLGTFLPLVILVAVGRYDLTPFAVFGAFVGIYSRVPGHLDRLLMQLKSAALMWLVILLAWVSGTAMHLTEATTTGLWLLVISTTCIAGLAAIIAGFFRLRPAGSLFHIFSFAAIAQMPNLPPLADGMFTTTWVMVLGLILGQLGRILPSRRTVWQVTPVDPLTKDVRTTVWVDALAYVTAAGIAGVVAALLTGPLNMNHVYWAMVSAVVPLAGHTTRHRMARAKHRVLGTLVGLTAIALIVLAQPPAWGAVFIVGIALFITELVVARNYFWASALITVMSLVGTTIGTTMESSLIYDRFIETLIGLVVGVLVALVYSAAQRRRSGHRAR